MVLFGTAIMLPVLFGNRTADGWAKWIYDFQTLITGFAAVAAAFFTISEMRRIASEQTSHHQENKRLATLEKRKKIVRFVRRVKHELTAASYGYDDYKNVMNRDSIYDFEVNMLMDLIHFRLNNFENIIEETKNTPIWDFLNGALESQLSSLAFNINKHHEYLNIAIYENEVPYSPELKSRNNYFLNHIFRSVDGVFEQLNEWEQHVLDEMDVTTVAGRFVG